MMFPGVAKQIKTYQFTYTHHAIFHYFQSVHGFEKSRARANAFGYPEVSLRTKNFYLISQKENRVTWIIIGHKCFQSICRFKIGEIMLLWQWNSVYVSTRKILSW